MSNTCSNCDSTILSGIIRESNYYCSEECYSAVIKKCEYCFKTVNIIKVNGVYNAPYFFCSENHMFLANPRIRFGVIGGPIGYHLGKPAIIIDCEDPIEPSLSQYVAPAPDAIPVRKGPPPGLRRQSPPPGLHMQSSPPSGPRQFKSVEYRPQIHSPKYWTPHYIMNGVPVFRPFPIY